MSERENKKREDTWIVTDWRSEKQSVQDIVDIYR